MKGRMKMTSNPMYINCRSGFAIYEINRDGTILVKEFTKTLRRATPFYGTKGAIVTIARKVIREASKQDKQLCYFVVVEPSLVGS